MHTVDPVTRAEWRNDPTSARFPEPQPERPNPYADENRELLIQFIEDSMLADDADGFREQIANYIYKRRAGQVSSEEVLREMGAFMARHIRMAAAQAADHLERRQ